MVDGGGRPGRGKVLVVGMDGVRFDRLPLPGRRTGAPPSRFARRPRHPCCTA